MWKTRPVWPAKRPRNGRLAELGRTSGRRRGSWPNPFGRRLWRSLGKFFTLFCTLRACAPAKRRDVGLTRFGNSAGVVGHGRAPPPPRAADPARAWRHLGADHAARQHRSPRRQGRGSSRSKGSDRSTSRAVSAWTALRHRPRAARGRRTRPARRAPAMVARPASAIRRQ